MRIGVTLAALLLAGTAAAQEVEEIVPPAAFEALSEGKTLYFELFGRPFGAEQYFPGRRVRWQFAEGICQEGTWFAEGDALCFSYDENPVPICWYFLKRGGTYIARQVGQAPEDGELTLVRRDEEPLDCPGPDTGV
ncbi:MAG: hypothetical protein AAFW69_02305 [Pseudomonadota bacterium]